MPASHELLTLLAAYTVALQRGAASTPLVDERPVYARRLAAALDISVALICTDPVELKRLIDQEERAVGRGYLVGEDGAAADEAFTTFATKARMSGATSAA